jgi:hypothetical protein
METFLGAMELQAPQAAKDGRKVADFVTIFPTFVTKRERHV